MFEFILLLVIVSSKSYPQSGYKPYRLSTSTALSALSHSRSLNKVSQWLMASGDKMREASLYITDTKSENILGTNNLHKTSEYIHTIAEYINLAAAEIENDNWESATIEGFEPASRSFLDASRSLPLCSNDLFAISKHFKDVSDITGCIVMASIASPSLHQAADCLMNIEQCILNYITSTDNQSIVSGDCRHNHEEKVFSSTIPLEVRESLTTVAESLRYTGLELKNFALALERGF